MSGQKHKNSSKSHGTNKPVAQSALQLQNDAAKQQKVAELNAVQIKGSDNMSVVVKSQIESVEKVEKQSEVKSAPRLVSAAVDVTVETKEDSVSAAKAASVAPSVASITAATGLVSAGTNAISEMVSASSSQAQKVQEKAVAVVRESAEHLSRSAQAATRSLDDAMNVSHEQIEAIMQYSNVTGEATRKLMDELFSFTNEFFARNVELSREVFSCRTMNDAMDLQNKMIQSNVDSVLTEASKISEMMFECATQVCDPIGERMSEVMERFSKSVAA